MYDRPVRMSYTFGGLDLHTADLTRIIRGPLGLRGRLYDVHVCVTTTTAGATTKPVIKVGKSGTLGESLVWDLGATTAPAGKVASATASNFAGADSYSKANPVMAADTDVYVTMVAATGSGAAGVGDVTVTIEWGI